MTSTLNTWGNVSAIANSIQDDAIFAIREVAIMGNLIRSFNDMSGMNPRVGYAYNQTTAGAIAEDDDLTSTAFTPSADQTLTPAEIGLQFFVSDARRDSELPENIISDAARELGLAAANKVELDLVADMASLTGGTIGAAGTVITWGYLSAAIQQARNAAKNPLVPLVAVLHGYQWGVLADSASIVGASVAPAPSFTDEITRNGYVGSFYGVPIYQTFAAVDSGTDFTGGVFPRDAIAIDWRRPIRVEGERDASRRGTEFNMSAVYAHGVWRPTWGIQMKFDAATPTA
jgi:hypothetical protein